MRIRMWLYGSTILLALLCAAGAFSDAETAVQQQAAGYRFPLAGRVYEDRN